MTTFYRKDFLILKTLLLWLCSRQNLILLSWPSSPMNVTKRTDYLSRDDYFMSVALLSAQRSKDPNTQVWACIVDQDKKIVWIWYNGFPMWCSDEILPRSREGNFLDTKYAYVCHGELNAITNSTKNLKGCTMYVAMFPCNECAKLIIQSGIKKIIYLIDKYAETDAVKASKIMFNQAWVQYVQLTPDKKEVTIKLSS